jgi:hypothetical protein
LQLNVKSDELIVKKQNGPNDLSGRETQIDELITQNEMLVGGGGFEPP